MHAADMTVILMELAIILVLARAAGWVFTRLGQPAVVGEILAGILLGPTLLGTSLSQDLFPLDSRPFLVVLANLGLVLFMFVVGLELDLSLIKGRERVAGSVSVASILLPFSLGLALATLLADDHQQNGTGFWPFALFIGAAMSVTAFPVLARILTDRGMHRTETGGLALACAATDDILAWTLLAVVIGIAGGEMAGDNQWIVALAVPFALLMIFVVRPQLNRLTGAYAKAGRLTPQLMSFVLLGLLLSSAATEYLHVHFIFGAFLFGAILPHEGATAMRHEILVRLEQISVLLLLPVFFLVSGLKVDLRALSTDNVVQLLLILAVAIVGKYVGAYFGARSAGVPHWQANSLGILMNTRGLTELVILNVGQQLGLIGQELFSMLVVMAVVTTIMTGPLLNWAYPKRRIVRDIAEAERAALGDAATDRVLVVAASERSSAALVDVAVGLLHHSPNAEVVVAALEPQRTRKLEMGSGLTDELAEMAASMERLEVLVRRGELAGVPVSIIANPSADVAADVMALRDALSPQYVVVWADDEIGRSVVDAAGCPAIVVAAHLDEVAGGSPVEITWSAGPDGEAAVALGCRLAASLGSAVHLLEGAGGRRFSNLRTALAERGVRLEDPADGLLPVTMGALGAPADLQVRAEPDASPVDWTQADLGLGLTEVT